MRLLSFLYLSLFLFQSTLPLNALDLQQPVPFDPAVSLKTLPNGFTYYIRKNAKPEKRAFLWLAIRAGSAHEEDDQQGLAHFLEHMAFNGTQNFEKQKLVDYLEKIGMRFGADLNAYTSFDETVYMLEVPTDNPEYLEKAFQILEDWAHRITLDPLEVEKERGVIKEEWRQRRGAMARIMDKQFPLIYYGSRYADRLPIGTLDVIDKAPRETLKRYYDSWYRPELMALIAVGDFDSAEIETRIQKQFSGLPKSEKPKESKFYPVPDHNETLVSIEKDPELRGSTIQILYKQPALSSGTVADYRRELVQQLYQDLVNNRLLEKSREAKPPYRGAFITRDNLSRDKDITIHYAVVKEGAFEEGITALALEARRVSELGFGAPELERAKSELLREAERHHAERDKTESSRLINGILEHFLTGNPNPDTSFKLDATKFLLPGVQLEEVNSVGRLAKTAANRVVLISAPDKPGLELPSQAQITSWLDQVEKLPLEPYQDEDLSKKPLIAQLPKPGKVVESKTHEALGVSEWRLENGLRVFLKPTDFKNDEILIQAVSPGGYSTISDEDWIAAATACDLLEESGLGDYNATQLEKRLAGKALSIETRMTSLREMVVGGATPKDFEQWFQLCHLYFSAPRFEEKAFSSYKLRMQESVKNRARSPEAVFGDAVTEKLYPGDLRRQPWTEKKLEQLDLAKSERLYRERFADIGDFAFFFVGSFKEEEIRPWVETYLGSLPGKGTRETWKNLDRLSTRGELELKVEKGLEPKSSVRLQFSDKSEWSPLKAKAAAFLSEALLIRLREVLREDKSGTYGVGAFIALYSEPFPRYISNISFSCAPENVEMLVAALKAELASIREKGVGEELLQKVRESNLRSLETRVKQNGYWLSNLVQKFQEGRELTDVLKDKELIESITLADLALAAKTYLDPANSLTAILNPEAAPAAAPPADQGK